MTDDERALLLSIAQWTVDEMDRGASERGTMSGNWADELRQLMNRINPPNEATGPNPFDGI